MPWPPSFHPSDRDVNSPRAASAATVHTSRLYLLAKTLEIMLDDDRIGADEIATYVAIQRRTDGTAHCRPAQSTLASELGKSRPWANAKVKRLVECDYLEVAHRFKAKGGQTSNLYYLPHLDRNVATIASSRGCHQDIAPCHDDDTPCHPADTNLTDSDLEEEISLSAQESGIFEKLCKGGDGADTAAAANPTTPPSAPAADPIQVRHPVTCYLIPDDWQPSKADLDWATMTRPDIDDIPRFTAKFVAKVNAGGGLVGPIWAKWRQWLSMEATPKSPSNRSPTGKPRPSADNSNHGSGNGDATIPPPSTPATTTTTNSVAAHNAAVRQETLNILSGHFAPKSTTAIEISMGDDHVR